MPTETTAGQEVDWCQRATSRRALSKPVVGRSLPERTGHLFELEKVYRKGSGKASKIETGRFKMV